MKDSDFINNEQINNTEDFSGGFNNNNETLVEFDEQETTNIIKVMVLEVAEATLLTTCSNKASKV